MDRFGQAFMTLGLSAVGARLLANLFNKEEKPCLLYTSDAADE